MNTPRKVNVLWQGNVIRALLVDATAPIVTHLKALGVTPMSVSRMNTKAELYLVDKA